MYADMKTRFNEVFRRVPSVSQMQGFAGLYERAMRGTAEAKEAQTAYILATAFWESGLTFLPVREGLAASDAEARAYVCGLFADGKIKVNYAEVAANGQAFYGRGLVQLTWEKNYRAIGDHLIGDTELFYNNPDLVMRPELAAIIMVRGMVDGIFTDHPLSHHINRDRVDYLHARQTVNRMDRAEKIAEWAEKMHYVIAGVASV